MHKEVRDYLVLRRKLVVLDYAKVCRKTAMAYREFEVPKSTFHRWKKAYEREGKVTLPPETSPGPMLS